MIFFTSPKILIGQTINATAAERYFEITDSLRGGTPISDELWESFIALEGNKQYINNQGFSQRYLNQLRRDLEVVYMPQHDSLLQTRLKDPQQNYGTYLINFYKKNEVQLRAYLQEIMANEAGYLSALYAQT